MKCCALCREVWSPLSVGRQLCRIAELSIFLPVPSLTVCALSLHVCRCPRSPHLAYVCMSLLCIHDEMWLTKNFLLLIIKVCKCAYKCIGCNQFVALDCRYNSGATGINLFQILSSWQQVIGAFLQAVGAFLQAVGAFLQAVGAFLQATSRVPRWWIGERPPDMAASCDIYK